MAFADSSTYFNVGDSSIIGRFFVKGGGECLVEFSKNNDKCFHPAWDFPHKIWVTNPIPNVDQGWRYGTVKKTVVYVVVDEDMKGEPVFEKWYIKQGTYKLYPRPEEA